MMSVWNEVNMNEGKDAPWTNSTNFTTWRDGSIFTQESRSNGEKTCYFSLQNKKYTEGRQAHWTSDRTLGATDKLLELHSQRPELVIISTAPSGFASGLGPDK